MSKNIPLDAPQLTWQGAASLERTSDGVMPWRINHEERDLFPPMDWHGRLKQPAGVRLTFRSNTQMVAGTAEINAQQGPIDIYCDGGLHAALKIQEGRFNADGLPAGEKLVEVWLPHNVEFRLKSLELSDGASLRKYRDPRPRWVVYGSSITHCRRSEMPSMTWPGVVAREAGLNLTCLGFGGSCHLDPMIARMVRDMPADYLTMKVGINIYAASSLSPRTFRAGIIGFVKTVREKHPETPFAVISPIISPPRETTPNSVEFTLSAMREEVADAVARLRANGDKNLHYFNGFKLFGPEHLEMMPDGLHPDAEGCKLMGYNFLREVWPILTGTPVKREAQ